ncbi:hypothetical protein FZEAL_10732, partial [Fusarium zealandicum]
REALRCLALLIFPPLLLNRTALELSHPPAADPGFKAPKHTRRFEPRTPPSILESSSPVSRVPDCVPLDCDFVPPMKRAALGQHIAFFACFNW